MNRDSVPLLVAALSGAFALLVAAVGVLSALLTSRRSAQATKELERFRHDLQGSTTKTDVLQREMVTRLSALSDGLSAIQLFRDELRLIVSAVEDSLATKHALVRLCEARDRIVQKHADALAHLTKEDQRVFHLAKNVAISTVDLAARLFSQIQYASQLDEDKRIQLSLQRDDLRDLQDQLRDLRIGLLGAMTVSSPSTVEAAH